MEILIFSIVSFAAGVAFLGWLVRKAKANPAGLASLALARFGL